MQQLYAPLAGAGDSFGQAIDVDGDRVVVGSRYSATVYRRQDPGTPLDDTDDVWIVEANLLGQYIWDKFGSAVALDGDHLLVGAPDHGMSLATGGAAYVFVRDDDTWVLQATFGPPTTDTITLFGRAVALDGDRLAVGDPWGHLTAGAPITGLVRVARRDDGGTPAEPGDDQWVTEALLVPSADGANFGGELELRGSELLVFGQELSKNRIYRFRLDDAGTPQDPTDDVWAENGEIAPPAGEWGNFGRDFDRDGDHLLVGADEVVFEYRLDDAGTPTDPLDDLWDHVGILKANDDTQYDDGFGATASLHGNRALVGAKKHTHFLAASGAAYLFERDDSAADGVCQWTQIAELALPGFDIKNLGAAVGLAGDVAYVGESGFFQFVGPPDSAFGRLRIFALSDEPWTFLDAALPGSSGVSPCLLGSGSLEPDSLAALVVEHSPPLGLAAIVLGAAVANVPFKGGVLVPLPQLVGSITTGADGTAIVSGRWPAHVPDGFSLFAQVWIADADGPEGFVATNAVRADAP